MRRQARACADLGSPLYAGLVARAADDLAAGGPVADVLGDLAETAPAGAALTLRLFGTVHRLVLERCAPGVAVFYPSVGGRCDPDDPAQLDAAWAAVSDLLAGSGDAVRAGLARPPQTNETGRAAALVGVLARVRARTDLPVRLVEIGTSGGLNLYADAFAVHGPGIVAGDPDSPLQLDPGWTDLPPDVSTSAGQDSPTGRDTPVARVVLPVVVERLGCDVDPVDVSTTGGRLLLTSYVWPDQRARLERLRAAFAVAATARAAGSGAVVRRVGAGDLLAELEVRPGTVTVVWHSVMWQYMDAAEQQRCLDRLESIGAGAHAGTPLLHAALEPRRSPVGPVDPTALVPGRATDPFVVTERWWPPRSGLPGHPTGDPFGDVVGTAPPHGVPVTWSSGLRALRAPGVGRLS